MNDDFGPVRLTFGDSLPYGHLRQICHTLRNGGLCILPSDTCYTLAALPFRRDSLANLASILPEKLTEKISLAFGSLALVEQYAKLTPKDQRLIDTHCPGPLTLVCEIADAQQRHLIEDMLHTEGTIGVRIPDSAVERQVSIELNRPITTSAIRDDTGEAVRSFDTAITIVRSRMAEQDLHFLFYAVKVARLPYREVSTVATVQRGALPSGGELVAPYSVFVIRPGELAPELLEDTARRMSPSDWEEWT